MLKSIAEKTVTQEDYSVTCIVIKLDRGFLIMVTDQSNFGIGTVVLSSPSSIDGLKPLSVPAPLFGLKHDLLSKMVAERATMKLKDSCLVLLYIKGLEKKNEKRVKTIMTTLDQTLDESIEKLK